MKIWLAIGGGSQIEHRVVGATTTKNYGTAHRDVRLAATNPQERQPDGHTQMWNVRKSGDTASSAYKLPKDVKWKMIIHSTSHMEIRSR